MLEFTLFSGHDVTEVKCEKANAKRLLLYSTSKGIPYYVKMTKSLFIPFCTILLEH